MRIVVPRDASDSELRVARLLAEELQEEAGVSALVAKSEAVREGDAVLRLSPGGSGRASDPEAYSLAVSRRIELTASDPAGLRCGVQTLLQCMEGLPDAARVPGVEIEDRPAYRWRALLLDPARDYLDPAFLRRTIRIMAAYKLNILHLHLTDDEGWRFELKGFPRCTPAGSRFYTQEEMRTLVSFAARQGVEVIPEFDLPGHSRAAIAAYPDLACDGRVPESARDAILCPGKEFTWKFIEDVVSEAAGVFPSPYLDLGADEPFAIARWAQSPDCLRRMRQKGVTTLPAFYHTFVADLDAIARRHGKTLIVWNDAVHPGVSPMPPRDIVIDGWTNYAAVRSLAASGYTIINSSSAPLYLSSRGYGAGFSLAEVCRWNPLLFGVRGPRGSPALTYFPLPSGASIVGGQACIWATGQALAEQRLYPRLLAVADTLWSGAPPGPSAGFQSRFDRSQVERLRRLEVSDDGGMREGSIQATTIR